MALPSEYPTVYEQRSRTQLSQCFPQGAHLAVLERETLNGGSRCRRPQWSQPAHGKPTKLEPVSTMSEARCGDGAPISRSAK
mmetsp:Transcript_52134/g.158371  ORF Transcript_52134/g.158371 Transcript_52134/m.158371 type:complete len:82 (-) Transcript_52134:55-300(-)